jgi:integrase
MPKAKLTKSYLDKIGPGVKDVIHWDTELPGFGAKVTPKGKIVFLTQYRPAGSAGNPRKFTLGPYGALTVDGARKQANDIINQAVQGRDPQRDRSLKRTQNACTQFPDLLNRFLSEHAAQNRSGDETRRILEREFLPPWKTQSVSSVRRADVIGAIDQIAARGSPIMANRALAAIRKFFNWCVGKDLLPQSPCNGLSAVSRETRRDRLLSDAELSLSIRAARVIGYPFGAMFEFLALTGQRREEAAQLRWSHFDREHQTWTIPAALSKNGKPHTVHLSSRAFELIDQAPRFASAISPERTVTTEDALVFSHNGHTVFQNWSQSLAKLKSQAKAIAARDGNGDVAHRPMDWRQHDLRRTMVSGMAAMGVAHHVADKILNHQSGVISGVAAVYQRHEFAKERKEAMENWSDHVVGLVAASERRVTANGDGALQSLASTGTT